MNGKGPDLTAILIAPDRELARQFSLTLDHTRTFQVLAELKAYPSRQALEVRLRQTKPDVVLLDLASGLDQACDLIRGAISSDQETHVLGLHIRNDSDAILRSLRAGASEFLYAPFEIEIQREAIARLRRLMQPQPIGGVQPGSIIAFSSAKPGPGASTLAAQTAF